MDPYLDPSHDEGRNDPVGGRPDPYWDPLRNAMGHTRAYSTRMDLAAAQPHDALASMQFCLANPGQEYLVFQPKHQEAFTLDLTSAPGTFAAEWFDVNKGVAAGASPVEGGAVRPFAAPFEGPTALYLTRMT
jgi:hypothetical protein